MKNSLWVEKYRPTIIKDVIGNEEAKTLFVEWLENKRPTRKAVLLYGPPGVGKTTLVNAAANEYKFRIIEMNASDTRSEKAVTRIADPATSFTGLDKFSSEIKGNMLFMDEVDGIAGNEDRGGVNAIIKIIENTRVPIIMAANDCDLEKLRSLKKLCLLIRFQQTRIPLIILALKKICEQEHIKYEFEALENIATKSQGDVRSAINDLQGLSEEGKTLTEQDTLALGLRNKDISMDDTLQGYFASKNLTEAVILLNSSNVEYDDLLMAISDNIPRRYADPFKLAEAYDYLSQADVFRGRVGVENWHLLKYVYNNLAQAAAVDPESYKSFEFISPPIRVITLFWTKNKRTLLANICTKIGAQCHISKYEAKMIFIPYLRLMLQQKKKAPALIEWLKLTPEEVTFLASLKMF
ncbi:replication factor C large subunit [Candidatus Bathycorpusculum sp.]|uniref:replication factor C large subunit n=1 Tax=Candidatus Bathycorpusculum sp. TaxID=2994959 RepID=UPI0031CCBF4F